MVRECELWRIVGRGSRRSLVVAGWITPIARNARLIVFDEKEVRAALRRVQREGYLLEQRLSTSTNGTKRDSLAQLEALIAKDIFGD